jgi:sterol carrier protein 2
MAASSQTDAYVLGVGMTPFIKPRKQRMYPELGFEAGVKAMLDAQVNYDDVETAVACYCYVRADVSMEMCCNRAPR